MRSRIKNFPSILLSVCILGAFLAFLAFPARYLHCVADGVTLWATSVLPAALPFLFLTGLLSQTPIFARIARWLSPVFRLFGISGAGGCAKNAGLKKAIEHVLKLKVIDLDIDPQLMGALGAAEYARQKGLAREG